MSNPKKIKSYLGKALLFILMLSVVLLSGCEQSYDRDDDDDDYDHDWYSSYSSRYSSSSSKKASESSSKSNHSSSSKTTSTVASSGDMQIYTVGSVKIGIPKEYVSQLTVVKKNESGYPYNVLLRVYEKASKTEGEKDMGEPMGMLFEIAYVKISKFNSLNGDEFPGSAVFAKDSTNYYIYTEPTDYQFYRSDGGTTTEQNNWQKLQKMGSSVKSHFLKVNKVTSSSISFKYNSVDDYPSYSSSPNFVPKDCSVCGGSGHCTHCIYGDCPSCYGKGRYDCRTCIGSGECGTCGGYGYVYKGTGQSFRKEECSRCDSSGDCSTCDGSRYFDCGVCDTSGNCNICDGTGDCSFCNGSGEG